MEFKNIKLKLKKVKAEYLIIAFAIIAILIIFASGISETKVETQDKIATYIESLENKLSTKLSQINGAGKVSVIISVKQGMITEIATEKKTVTETGIIKIEEAPVLVSGKPIVLAEKYPDITGVVIIAKGANDLSVRVALVSATQTILGITSDKIEILTMR